MDWEIGEIRQINDEWYQCLEDANDCCDCDNYCDLYKTFDYCQFACTSGERIDNKSVYFKKLEKVGKPYNDCGTILQRFKIYTNVTNADTKGLELHIYSNNTIGIEIKQIKKDMEEKELIELLSEKVHNAWMKEKEAQGFSYGKEYDKEKKKHPDMLPYNELKEDVKEYDRATVRAVLQAQKGLSADANKLSFKEFNLEAAKAGKPVCTRDGRSARIICFDKIGKLPIVALVKYRESENIYCYYNNGKDNKGDEEKDYDLVMKPEIKSGWININKNNGFYETEEDAKKNQLNDDFVAVKVEFEV